jgi:prepilin-type N-terminal cleavage/methylation domain-containing protein
MLRDHHGFTLIEMIFVLAITVVLASFGFLFHTPHVSDEDEIRMVSNIFSQARLQACAMKERQYVVCKDDDLQVSSTSGTIHITLNKGYHFVEDHDFYYSNKGHIRKPKTVYLKSPSDKIYAFVFQLGSGTFYVRS